MQITQDQVRHIARLARLNLTPSEVEKFAGQLSAIVGYIEHLGEVDTSSVVETNQVTGLTNVSRPDVVVDFPYKKELLACSRNPIEENQIKVKKSI
jgi:aspartyl-tRNA(Asn)/glutamyl-tRNA(Gln) amidotransferase subunit C